MLFFAALLFVSLVGCGAQGRDCSLKLQCDLNTKFEPLILNAKNNGPSRIQYPEALDNHAALRLRHTEQLRLVCTGKKGSRSNIQTTSGRETADLLCNNGHLEVMGRYNCDLSQITACTVFTTPSTVKILGTNNVKITCGKGIYQGFLVETGFQVENHWIPLVRVCYNSTYIRTLYVTHVVQKAVNMGLKSRHGTFQVGDTELYPDGYDPRTKYSKESVQRVFKKILDEKQMKNIFGKNNDYIAKGHLAPHADFIYSTEKGATYFYVNAAPQWQKFNTGNWLYVENTVRSLAETLGRTLKVWTGTYGTLKLYRQEWYLDPDNVRLPIPEVFWKLIHDPLESTCTVAVFINNPYLETEPKLLCGDYNTLPPDWRWLSLRDLNKGFGYYCTYPEFKSKVVDYDLKLDKACDNGLLNLPQ